MLEIGNKSLFSYGNDSGYFIIARILEFYNLVGKNIICFSIKGSSLSGFLIKNKVVYYNNVGDLLEKIKSNVFRADYLLIESDHKDIISYVRKISNLPIIIATEDESYFDLNEFDTAYSFYIKRNDFSLPLEREYYVSFLKDNIHITLESLRIQYIREHQLSKIFKK